MRIATIDCHCIFSTQVYCKSVLDHFKTECDLILCLTCFVKRICSICQDFARGVCNLYRYGYHTASSALNDRYCKEVLCFVEGNVKDKAIYFMWLKHFMAQDDY